MLIFQSPAPLERFMAASPKRAPLPEAFGQVFGFWLKDQPRGEYVFARAAGQKPVSSQAARAYLRGMLQKAGTENKDQSGCDSEAVKKPHIDFPEKFF